MHLVPLNGTNLFEQLSLEEAILRVGEGEWCLINTNVPPAICMGISGKPEELIEAHAELPLIRRFSGGGCVVTDENTLFITFIGDMPAPTPCKIHCYAERKLKKAFPTLPFELRENDYILNNKKFGGNAQYITKNRFLHHTSLLWDYSPEKMALLKHPKKQPSYREERPHTDFLTSLKPLFPSKEKLVQDLIAHFALNATLPTTKLLAELLDKPHRKALVALK